VSSGRSATSSEALEAPDTQRVIEAFKDMPGRELVEMIGHARRLEKRLRRVAHNIVGPYVGIEEHSERVANALTELDRLQQSAQSENTTTTEARAGLSQGAPISGSTPDASALSATRCTACGAKEGEPCRGNCERAMPSSIGESGAAEYELLDAAVAFIERNAASVFALEGFDRLSMAIHNHPGAHIKVEDRASRSATGESVVEEARSMLHTCEHITRLTEGMHTYDTAFVLRLCRAIVAASDGNINK
jgi:hypothetical protein